MGLSSYIAKQFSNPRGLGGKIISAVMNKQNHPMYEETERLLSLSSDDFVLDIGCGNGYFGKRCQNCIAAKSEVY